MIKRKDRITVGQVYPTMDRSQCFYTYRHLQWAYNTNPLPPPPPLRLSSLFPFTDPTESVYQYKTETKRYIASGRPKKQKQNTTRKTTTKGVGGERKEERNSKKGEP